ncbi:thiamine pyrophosphokinase [Litoribacter ruber]|uniref:thiamine pyrophosphokinase n=1 Tax=Litoribacter ruber TaxID=702568 RepID=UPI001BDABC6E|nr:thiamine pyrophosphokinase [Litoribacter ruber]MBT0809823.1 thiamine pyrophosphokinase [Litoribacter ruber]
MSSHHFVKENQEPALVILGLEGLDYDTIAPLLEWVPTVAVTEETVEKVISLGIKIDLILASIGFQKENIHLLEEQYPVRFMTAKEGKYLEEGLQYLVASKHSAVNILGYDHLKVFSLLDKLEFLNIVIWDGPMRYFPVKGGRLKKYFSTGSLQLHAAEDSFVEMVNAEGSELIQIKHATFVEVEEGMVELKAKDLFWVGELQGVQP